MTLEEYMRELVLMSRQYGQEEELYPLINMLLRENDNVRHLSVRDVHQSQSSGIRHDMLYGYASFPDIAILKEEYSCSIREAIIADNMSQFNDMCGCVEVKNWMLIDDMNVIAIKELKLDDVQLMGELFWYGKVLYTNGLYWYYLESNTSKEVNIINQIIKENSNKKDLQKKLKEKENKLKLEENKENKETLKNEIDELNNEISESNNKIEEEKKKIAKLINEKYNNEKYTCVDIGNMEKMVEYINAEKSSMKDIVQGIIENPDILKEWHRLKYNLASIDWCGTNEADQFI